MAKLKASSDKLPCHLNIYSLLLSQKRRLVHLRVEDFVWQSQCWDALDGLEQLGCFVKGIVLYKPLLDVTNCCRYLSTQFVVVSASCTFNVITLGDVKRQKRERST